MVTTLEDLRSKDRSTADFAVPPPPSKSATVPAAPDQPDGSRFRRLRIEGITFIAVPLSAYLTLGYLLAFHWHSYFPDAQSRLANGFYVLYSRDPHLSSVGFVWQPFTSLAAIPLLLLKGLWPPLVDNFFAANIMSALWMALAVHNVRRTMLESGVATPARLALTALFAFNPMIFYYGSNGMSEAPYLLFLIIAVRYLVRWMAKQRTVDLIVAGIGVGLAYLTRNEAVFSGAFATVAVFAVSYRRAGDLAPKKFMTALTDATIFVFPFALCFVGWAGVSWLIVGHPFEQLQGTYGTQSMISVSGGVVKGSADYERQRPGHVLHDVIALGPLLPTLLAAGAALVVRRRRKDYRPLAAISVLGGALLFSIASAITHKTGGFLRYYIAAVPLSVLLAAAIAARRPQARQLSGFRRWWLDTGGTPWNPRVGRVLLSVVAVVVVIPGVATAWMVMHNGVYGSEEYAQLSPLFHLGQKVPNPPAVYYDTTLGVAKYIDSLKLSNGSVLVDNADACVPFIILLSQHPAQFIIPNDRDFEKTLADPAGFQLKYILAIPPTGLGAIDAVNRGDPDLYKNGGGIAHLVKQTGGGPCPPFRLYKVVPLAP